MSDVIAARDAYKATQDDSKALLTHARMRLGRAIHDARQQRQSQEAIADQLDLTRERLRLYQREYEKAAAKGEVSPRSAVELAARIVRLLIDDERDLTALIESLSNDR